MNVILVVGETGGSLRRHENMLHTERPLVRSWNPTDGLAALLFLGTDHLNMESQRLQTKFFILMLQLETVKRA